VPESPQNVIKTSIDTAAAPLAKLQPDAISGTQDVIIGMASSAPAASIGLTIAALAATTAYGSGAIILFTAIPMLVIANAYRRLNLWNANCGASFEWVGRAINPYLGFLTGWLMIAAYVIATVSGVEVLGPTVLAVFGADSASTWADIAIGTGVGVIMLVIAVIGIKVTARTQVGMAFIEYTLLIGFGIAGLVMVLLHRHGTVPLSRGWLSFSGIGGKGSAAAPQSRPRRHRGGDRARRDLHAVHGGPSRDRPGEGTASQLGVGARLHRAGHRRTGLGQGHGACPGAVGHRHHRHRDRARRPDRVRDGQQSHGNHRAWD